MMYLLIIGILLVFFIDFEIISLILKKGSENFEKNKKYGTAEVVGYDSSEQSRWYSLIVKVYNLNDGKTYVCASSKINILDYPKGTIVDVIYANCKYFGINMMRVHLADKPPANDKNMAKVFRNLGYIFLIAMIITFVIGVIAIL